MAIKIKGSTIIDDSRIVVNADKIGIGTTNPQVALEIYSGDVGIGTTNPRSDNIETSLDTNTNILAVGIVTANEYYGTFKGTVDPAVAANRIQQGNTKAEVIDTGLNGHFIVETEGAERLRINETGHVGIGTDDPTGTNAITGNNAKLAVGVVTAKELHVRKDVFLGDDSADDSVLVGGLHSQVSEDTSKFAVQGASSLFNNASNIGIIQVHAGGYENIGDLAGYSFSHGVSGSTARAKAAIAFESAGGYQGVGAGYGRGDLCFYVDNAFDNDQVSAEDERLRITRFGDVGIGTTNPTGPNAVSSSNTTKLAVGIVTAREYYGTFKGTVDPNIASNRIEQGDTKAEVIDTGTDGRFVVTTEGNERFSINSGGNLLAGGITTSLSGFMFGSSTLGGPIGEMYLYKSANNAASLRITIDGPYVEFKDEDGDVQMGSAGSSLGLSANGEEKVRITSDGKVGIGTTNPQGNLHISSGTSGDATLILEADTDNNNEADTPYIVFRQDGGINASAIGHGVDSGAGSYNGITIANSISSGFISFATGTAFGYTNATERLRITSTGDVGIGTKDPDAEVTSSNTSKLAVGIVTANEYYGTFKGTIDPAVADDRIQQGDTIVQTIDTGSDGQVKIITNNVERVLIDPYGYLIARGDIRVRREGGAAGTQNNGGIYFGDSNNNYIFGEDSVETLTLTGGSGNFVAGELVTGGLSGVTAVVKSWDNSNLKLIIHDKTGSFQNGETVTSPSNTTGRNVQSFTTTNADLLAFATAGEERLRINETGHVGIGTNNPTGPNALTNNTAKLAVGIVTANEYYGTFKGTIDPAVADDKIQKGNTKAQVVDNNGDGHFLVETEGTERLRITGIGSVGIGTTDPLTKLDVRGDINFNNNALISHIDQGMGGIGGNNIDHIWHQDANNVGYGAGGIWNFVSDSTYKAEGNSAIQIGYLINSGGGHFFGNVGIGTTIPTGTNALTNNTAKLAVGIVTANEYYGLFKGTIDTTVNSISLNTNLQDIFSVSGNQLSGKDAGADKIVFWDDTNTGGELSYLTVGTGLEITNAQLNATKDAGKTYTLPLTGTDGGNGVGIVTWTLTDDDSPVATDTVTLKAGSNISISNVGTSDFTIEAVQGAGVGIAASASAVLNVNGGEIGGVNPSGNDDKLVYWDEDGGTDGRLDYLTIGTGLKIETGSLKIDSSVVGKSYTLPVTVEDGTSGSGGASGIATITLTDDVTPTAGTDPVTIEAGDGIVIESATDGFKISADISEGGGGGVSDVQVKQYSDNADPRTERNAASNPIDVQKSVGIVTIGIGTTSNAYGNRFVGPNTPTGAIEGDIWYDTTTTGQGTNRIAVLRDEKTAGAYGGKPGSGEYTGYKSAYYPPGSGGQWDPDAWFPRNINTEYDPSNFVSVGIGSTNVFGLEAGSYKISWRVPAHQTDRFQSRLAYNTNSDFSGTTSYYYGTSQYSGGHPQYPSGGNPSDSGDESEGEFIANIPATTYFRIEQWIYAIPYYAGTPDFSESALGVAINRDSNTNAILNPLAPGHEVYTQVKIEDLATAVKDEGFSNKIQQGDTKAEVIDTGTDGHFIVETEGQERLRLTSDGHAYFNTCVGIGSTTPRQKFDVIGKQVITDTGGDVLKLESTVDTSRTTIRLNTNGNEWELGARGSGAQNATNSFYIFDYTASEYRLVINPTGNVGIGTKDAIAKLDVRGGTTGITTSVVISGSVGIGITHPDSALDVVSSNDDGTNTHLGGTYNDDGQTAVRRIEFGTKNYRNSIQSQQGSGGDNFSSDNDLLLNPLGGNIGIGTTNPDAPVTSSNTAKLAVGIVTAHEAYINALNLDTTGAGVGDLLTSGGPDGIFGIYNTTNSGKTIFPVKDSSGNYNDILELLNDRAIIDGNVGIGSTIPKTKLDVHGTDAIVVPVGTTAERPSNASSGMFRYNTTEGQFEGYTNTWGAIAGGGGSGSGNSFVLLAEQTATGGTSVEFTGIPSDAMEITLMFKGISASGTDNFKIQLGTSSGYITSGYDSLSQNEGGGDEGSATDCFIIRSTSGGYARTGSMLIKKASDTSYVQTGQFAVNPQGTQGGTQTYGSLSSVSGTVDRLKVILSGNDTFDAGTMNVSYKTPGGGSTAGKTKIAIIQDEKPDGTNGGIVSAINTWLVRDLNAVTDPNSVGISSISDGKFSLPAGSYAINFSAPAMHVDEFQARLAYNTNSDFTGTTNYVYGSSEFSGFTASSLGDIASHSSDRSRGESILTLSQLTYFRIEQSFETSPADGAGNKFNYALGVDAHRGNNEVYTQVRVQDLATAIKEQDVGTTKVAVLQDVRAQNTHGGTATANNWHQRRLNSKIDPANFVAIVNGSTGKDGTANTFTLEAGTYLLQWRAPGWDSGNMRAKMAYTTSTNYNTLFATDGSAGVSYLNGESAQSNTVNETNAYATGSATVSISQTTYFRLQHYIQQVNATYPDRSLGHHGSVGDEIYSQVVIQDLATAVKSQDTGTAKVAVIKDQKNTGVEGGLFVKDAWRDRDLTEKDDPFNFVTLYATTNGKTTPGNGGSNASTGAADYKGGYFSLPAGKYRIKFRAPAASVREHMAAIGWSPTQSNINKRYNTSGGDFDGGAIYGSSEVLIMNNNTNVNKFVLTSNFSEGSGIVEISETNYFKVIHYSKDTSQNSSGGNENYGFGKSVDLFDPDPETYTIVEVEDLATAVRPQDTGTTRIAVVKDQKNTGIDGGTFTQNAWRDRDLTVKDDPFNFVTLYPTTNGQANKSPGDDPGYFTLPAGKYKIRFRAPAFKTNQHMARMVWSSTGSTISKTYATTDSFDGQSYGTSEFVNDNYGRVTSASEGVFVVEITQTSYFKVLHYGKDTEADNGFGEAATIGSDPETYTVIEIEDLATAVKSGVNASDKIEEGNTKAEVIDTGTDKKFKVTVDGEEKLEINSDGDQIISHLAPPSNDGSGSAPSTPPSTVFGGGIYTRTIDMGDNTKGQYATFTVTKPYFNIEVENGAIAGTMYITVNGPHLTAGALYHFVMQAGGTKSLNLTSGLQTYGTWYELSADISTSGSYGQIHTINVTSEIKGPGKNSQGVGTNDMGPSNPCVTVTLVLGACNKNVTVTKP